MLLDWPTLVDRYHLADRVTGVLHLGAHLAEEADDYAKLGVPVWWVEANPALVAEITDRLRGYPRQYLIPALLSGVDGEMTTLHISGPGYRGSSSILEWGTHKTFSPLETVAEVTLPSITLDSLWEAYGGFSGVNMVVTDLQGADGMVLGAGRRLLAQVDWVMSEVNVDEVYRGCMRLPELDEMLALVDRTAGPSFERVETYMVPGQGWGDALWRRGGL